MARRVGCAAVILGLLLGLTAPAPAQSYLTRTYTVNDGLPSSEVFDVAQDTLGRMWFATRAGLVVYDGLGWQPVPSHASLPGAPSIRLEADPAGVMWVTSTRLEALVTAFSTAEWGEIAPVEVVPWQPPAELELDTHVRVSAFAVLPGDGGTRLAVGLWKYGLLVREAQSWIFLDRRDGLPSDQVTGVVPWRGGFLVATDGGLCSVHDGVVGPPPVPSLGSPAETVLAVAVRAAAGDGRVAEPTMYALGRHRLYRLDAVGWEVVAAEFVLEPAEPYPAVLLPMAPRCVYFGQKHRLFHLDEGTGELESLDHLNGLAGAGATGLTEDREGDLWITSLRGVSKLVSRRFASYRQRHGLLEDEVASVCERSDGDLVFGHNTGLTVLDGDSFVRLPFALEGPLRPMPPRAMDLLVDEGDRVWVAASSRGLAVLEPDNRLRWLSTSGQDGDDSVFALVRAADGRLLAGGGTGLYQLEGSSLRARDWDSHRLGGVRRLCRRRNGAVLAATSLAGLVRVGQRGNDPVAGPDLDGFRNAYTVFEDSRERVWVGTRAGPLVFDGESVREPSEDGLRFGQPVFQIVEDAGGALWFGTDDGVLRWDGSMLRRYSMADGLAGKETNRAAALLDSHGELWFGTESGVSVYRPEHDLPEPDPPEVRLVGIEAEGRGRLAAGSVSLDHEENTLTFTYAGVSFVDEEALSFRYSLEGFDHGWSSPVPAHQRSVRYTNLAPGTYRFGVQAARGDGSWSLPAMSPALAIRKPLWGRWWFPIFAALALTGAAMGVSRIVVRYRYAARLEREIGRRQEAEERTAAILRQLEDSRSSFAALVEQAEDGVVIVDSDRQVHYANAAACRFLGQSLDELETLPSDLSCEPGEVSEIPVRRADGEVGSVQVRSEPSTWQGRDVRKVVLRDVTAERRTEAHLRQAQKIEAMGQLAGGVAHDFNNLLQAILAAVEALRRRGGDSEGQAELVAELAALVQQGGALTGQLLRFSRSDVTANEVVVLDELVEESMSLLRRLVREDIRIVLDLCCPDACVEVDRSQVGQVVTNLVVNACDAMPDGGRLTLRTRRQGSEAVLLEVEDTGGGLAPDLRERVFEPFFTTKDRDRGTGLGLSVVRGIVARHGGIIEVGGEVGVGAVFRVTLPLAEGGPAPGVHRRAEGETMPSGHGQRVLLVEDDPNIRDGLAGILSHVGYRVTQAASAEEAGLRAGEQRFDALVSDLVLPGDRGDALARGLRQRWPTLAVVFMSGYSEHETTLSALRISGARFLRKPFSGERLCSALHEVLSEAASSSPTSTDGERAGRRTGAAPTLLVVEDDATLRTLIGSYLEFSGYHVELAGTATEAADHLMDSDGRIDLVISDLDLPEANGFVLCLEARASHPDLPFVFCSGDLRAAGPPPTGTEQRAALIQKPFDLKELVRAIEELLEG